MGRLAGTGGRHAPGGCHCLSTDHLARADKTAAGPVQGCDRRSQVDQRARRQPGRIFRERDPGGSRRMRATPILADFTRGVITPYLWGRTDWAGYFSALKRLENFLVLP